MVTKLTLTVEKEVIERAKVYAKETGRSLSEMIETYLDIITSKSAGNGEFSARINRLAGSLPLPEDFDDDKARREYLEKKHL